MESKSKKIFYTIGEAARIFNVNVSLIRYWEKEFSILKPKKNKKGNRLFTQKDIDNLHLIYNLIKERGYTLDGAQKQLKNNKNLNSEIEIINRLKKIRSFLVDLKNEL